MRAANREIGVPGFQTEVPALTSEFRSHIEITDKPINISGLQVFAFYAPISDVPASDMQFAYFGEVQNHASSFERGCWGPIYGMGRAGP
jgi:hypothetical protein